MLKLNGELRALAKGPSSSGGARPSSSSGGASPKKKKQDKKQKKRQKKEQKKSLPAAMETEAKVSGGAPDAMALVRGALTGRCLLVSGSPRSGKSTLVAHALDKIGSCFVKAELFPKRRANWKRKAAEATPSRAPNGSPAAVVRLPCARQPRATRLAWGAVEAERAVPWRQRSQTLTARPRWLGACPS